MGTQETGAFEQLFLGSGSATADATTALTLLPPEQAKVHLPRLDH